MCTGLEMLLLGGAMFGTAVSGFQQAAAMEEAGIAQGRALAQQAGQEQDAANAEAQARREAARLRQGEASAALAAAGVSVDAGTPLVIAEDIWRQSESDALNTIINGNRRAGYLQDEGVAAAKAAKDQANATRVQTVGSVIQMGASAMTAGGWRSAGPGFAGTQAMAPVETRTIRR